MSEVKARANVLLEEAARPSLAEVGATLRELGLGGYAADAFCALVRVSEATAGDLVRKTGIPDSKIYYALAELAGGGPGGGQSGEAEDVPRGPAAGGRDPVGAGSGREVRAGARGGAARFRPARAPAGCDEVPDDGHRVHREGDPARPRAGAGA